MGNKSLRKEGRREGWLSPLYSLLSLLSTSIQLHSTHPHSYLLLCSPTLLRTYRLGWMEGRIYIVESIYIHPSLSYVYLPTNYSTTGRKSGEENRLTIQQSPIPSIHLSFYLLCISILLSIHLYLCTLDMEGRRVCMEICRTK